MKKYLNENNLKKYKNCDLLFYNKNIRMSKITSKFNLKKMYTVYVN